MDGDIFNRSYLDFYDEAIAPKLRELDIFIKERISPIAVWQAAQLLDMPYNEILRLMKVFRIPDIDYETIFKLMLVGTSELCRFIQREAQRGFLSSYSAEDISYIYNIDISSVSEAFMRLNISFADQDRVSNVLRFCPAK